MHIFDCPSRFFPTIGGYLGSFCVKCTDEDAVRRLSAAAGRRQQRHERAGGLSVRPAAPHPVGAAAAAGADGGEADGDEADGIDVGDEDDHICEDTDDNSGGSDSGGGDGARGAGAAAAAAGPKRRRQ